MKRKTILFFIVMSLFANAADCEHAYAKYTGHRLFLRQNFDVVYWKTIWTDDTWHICCMFVDFDGDGLEEMMAITSSEEDPMGDYWKIWKQGNGRMKQVQLFGNLFYWCHAPSFYKMLYRNGSCEVLGIGMRAGYMDKDRRNVIKPTPDCRFVFPQDDKYYLKEIEPDLDMMFMVATVTNIERLYPEWFFGFDFKPPKDVPHNPYLQRPPYKKPLGDLRLGGGIAEPSGFSEFLKCYRQEKKFRFAIGDRSVTVYSVFLDADNDGDADFYITSDLDRLEDGNFSWELFVRQGHVMSKARNAVCPVTSRKDLCALPQVVNTTKDSFCRVVRLDVAPVFLIADQSRKNQIRDTIRDINVHRVEKLPCRTYPDTHGEVQ